MQNFGGHRTNQELTQGPVAMRGHGNQIKVSSVRHLYDDRRRISDPNLMPDLEGLKIVLPIALQLELHFTLPIVKVGSNDVDIGKRERSSQGWRIVKNVKKGQIRPVAEGDALCILKNTVGTIGEINGKENLMHLQHEAPPELPAAGSNRRGPLPTSIHHAMNEGAAT
jgi:hypothetical protein